MKNAEREKLYLDLHAQGKSCKEIAEAVGVAVSSIASFLKRRGLHPNGQGNLPLSLRDAKPDGEITRPCVSAPGYAVTADGKVYSEKTDPPRLMATKTNNAAGPRVALSIDGQRCDRYVALLVLEAWVGPRAPGEVRKHLDGDPNNCRADNLAWRPAMTKIDLADLVRAWKASSSIQEVAERIGATCFGVYLAAKRLKEMGVPLKDFHEKYSAEELIQVAKEEDEL